MMMMVKMSMIAIFHVVDSEEKSALALSGNILFTHIIVTVCRIIVDIIISYHRYNKNY